MIEPIVREVAWGNYVRYEDYAKVKEAGQNILQHLRESTAEVERLKAEVERLTKAGDAMASSIQFNEEMSQDYNGPTIVHQSVQRWNAAKEGKQS
jgi:archaellum component FlaC